MYEGRSNLKEDSFLKKNIHNTMQKFYILLFSVAPLTATHLCQLSGNLLIPVPEKVFGGSCIQRRTPAMMSPLFWNLLPPKNPFVGSNK
jgi:hypothetical protein